MWIIQEVILLNQATYNCLQKEECYSVMFITQINLKLNQITWHLHKLSDVVTFISKRQYGVQLLYMNCLLHSFASKMMQRSYYK